MALGLGRWTVERVGSRVREMADSVREMADNLPRTQMPAVRMPPWVRLPEVKMTPAPRRGVHPLWVVAGGAPGGRARLFFLPPPRARPPGGGRGEGLGGGGGGEGLSERAGAEKGKEWGRPALPRPLDRRVVQDGHPP